MPAGRYLIDLVSSLSFLSWLLWRIALIVAIVPLDDVLLWCSWEWFGCDC